MIHDTFHNDKRKKTAEQTDLPVVLSQVSRARYGKWELGTGELAHGPLTTTKKNVLNSRVCI